MSAKQRPVEWIVDGSDVIAGEYRIVQTKKLSKQTAIWNKGETRSNALLIAAAPKLLQACKYYVEYCNHNPCNCLIARQAIAKAESRP